MEYLPIPILRHGPGVHGRDHVFILDYGVIKEQVFRERGLISRI